MKRVLLLEDEFYRYEKLVHAPVQVFWAKNEYEASQLLKAGPYDIMIWDRDLGAHYSADEFVKRLDLSKVKDHVVWSWNKEEREKLASMISDHVSMSVYDRLDHGIVVAPFGPEFYELFAKMVGYDQQEIAEKYEGI